MTQDTSEVTKRLLEELYDTAWKAGYKQAYEEMVPILKSVYDRVKEKQI